MTTPHYGLKTLTSTAFAEDSWKYTNADRMLIDMLLWLGVEGHHHTGSGATLVAASAGPLLTIVTTGGSMPAGARARYVFTFIDGNGIESGPSPETFIDTPPAVSSPAVATNIVIASTGGTLVPGPYFYAITAYKDADYLETMSPESNHFFVGPVPLGTATNTITFTLPLLPGGADGFNIYRKGPANSGYRYLTSIAAPDPGDTFADLGALTEDPDRTLPTINSTKGTNIVQVALPVALPGGYHWRIYRTFTAGVYTGSLLTTTNAATYDDIGALTATGQPPAADLTPGSPPKVLLTDGAEVQGVLPATMVAGLYGVFQEVEDAGAPHGWPQLDVGAQIQTPNLPGSVLIGLAATFR